MAAVTPTTFRAAFPEFKDPTLYPDTEIQFWLDLSPNLLNANRWGALFNFGVQLFTAHNLSLQYSAVKAGQLGAQPGVVNGPQTAGSVDKVSYSRNPGLVMDPKNGHWNLTTYGLRYLALVNMIGAGPVQVGACGAGSGVLGWPGVIYPLPWQ